MTLTARLGLAGSRRVGVLLLAPLAAMLAAAPLVGADAGAIDLYARFSAPLSAGHALGTDHLGRDVLARVVAGAPWSLGVAVAATLIAGTVGIALGLATARARPEGIGRRAGLQLINLTLAFPGLVAAICLVALIGQGFATLVLVLGLLTSPIFARVTFAEASSLLTRDYVTAARLAGVGEARLLWRHVLPGMRPTLAALAAFHVGDMLIAETALSFLGIGAPLDEATWGNMLADSRAYLFQAPWMMLAPAAAMIAAVLAATLLGGSRTAARAEGAV
ncbi:MAG: ABC transporter permease [Alphaproteobacteria bacterium]|nr:ABC transporter permease [Alphaproteobacteria bacterium]